MQLPALSLPLSLRAWPETNIMPQKPSFQVHRCSYVYFFSLVLLVLVSVQFTHTHSQTGAEKSLPAADIFRWYRDDKTTALCSSTTRPKRLRNCGLATFLPSEDPPCPRSNVRTYLHTRNSKNFPKALATNITLVVANAIMPAMAEPKCIQHTHRTLTFWLLRFFVVPLGAATIAGCGWLSHFSSLWGIFIAFVIFDGHIFSSYLPGFGLNFWQCNFCLFSYGPLPLPRYCHSRPSTIQIDLCVCLRFVWTFIGARFQ